MLMSIFFFNDTATTEIYTYGHTLSLHDALPISRTGHRPCRRPRTGLHAAGHHAGMRRQSHLGARRAGGARARDWPERGRACARDPDALHEPGADDGNQPRRPHWTLPYETAAPSSRATVRHSVFIS